jgi:hypothetical protein
MPTDNSASEIADTMDSTGGLITATGVPLRVTTMVSPDSTASVTAAL